MAVDKLVDSGKLDACCAAEAAAIIAKGGGTAPLAYDFANNKGFTDAINSIPSGGAEITDGIVVKARDANGYTTEIDIYGNTIYRDTVYGNTSYAYNYNAYYLEKIDLKNKPTKIAPSAFTFNGNANVPCTIYGLENVTYLGQYAFYNQNSGSPATHKSVSLNDIDISKIDSLNSGCFFQTELSGDIITKDGVTYPESWPASVFYGTKIKSFRCKTDAHWNGSNWQKCPNLVSVITEGTYLGSNEFKECPLLQEVTIGRVGRTVQSINNSAFSGCTQNDLVVTIYTEGNKVNTLLTNIRNGATNATIIIKASKDTTYSGTSYAAGDTMITSTP